MVNAGNLGNARSADFGCIPALNSPAFLVLVCLMNYANHHRKGEDEMSIGEIMAALAGAAAVLSTFLEVSKIKINPWSAIFKWIGNKMMEDVKVELREVKKEQEQLKAQRAADAMDAIKAEVFRFYNECQRGQRHSDGEFNYIIQQNEKYEKLVEETKDPNGVYEMEYLYIMEIYRKCQKEKDFL